MPAGSSAAFRSRREPTVGHMTQMQYGEGQRLAAVYTVAGRRPSRRKSILVAYVLLALLGPLAAHRFYLGATGTGIVMLILTIGSALLSIIGVGLVGLLLVLTWMLVDAVLLPGMLRDYNDMLATRDAGRPRY